MECTDPLWEEFPPAELEIACHTTRDVLEKSEARRVMVRWYQGQWAERRWMEIISGHKVDIISSPSSRPGEP